MKNNVVIYSMTETFALMTSGAFSRNVGNLFCEQLDSVSVEEELLAERQCRMEC